MCKCFGPVEGVKVLADTADDDEPVFQVRADLILGALFCGRLSWGFGAFLSFGRSLWRSPRSLPTKPLPSMNSPLHGPLHFSVTAQVDLTACYNAALTTARR